MGRMDTGTLWRRLTSVCAALALAACGGNGGGGTSSVVYSGVTTPAAVTGNNGVSLATAAYQGGNSGGSLALVGAMTDPLDGTAGRGAARALALSRVLTGAAKGMVVARPASPQVATGATVSVSDSLGPGSCGGTASYSGTANDATGEFSATFTFRGWCNDGVTVSGLVTASGQIDLSGPDPVLVALEFSFTMLSVTDGTDTFRSSGVITASFDSTETLTITMDFENGDGTVFRASNLAISVTPTVSGDSVVITGRVYHPVHGYVDITTPQAFAVPTGETFPEGGQLVVTGGSGSKARLTALSTTTFQVEVDADGDDTYETDLGSFAWLSV